MAVLTVFVLLAIAGFVKKIAGTPTVARAAALATTAPATRHAALSRSGRPSPSASVQAPQVGDASSGLSYRLLSRPWRRGCPGVLDTPPFSWTAGEHAVAGYADIGGTVVRWHGNACSGPLAQQFAYSGPADLEPAAVDVAAALEPLYYAGLQHDRTLEGSTAMQVSGHPAWMVTFLISYPDAASEGLAWTSEAAAVVVVDRGTGLAPAVFYASVPDNLGTAEVSTLIGSLQLHP